MLKSIKLIANYILASVDSEIDTINFVDIDDTIFKTDTRIRIIDKDGNVKKRLTTEEFDKYVLKPGESYDFSESLDSEIFYKTAKPIKNVLDKINDILNNAKNNKIIFLTARADMNDKHKFLSVFKKYGIPVDNKNLVYIERAGNLMLEAPIAKRIIIEKYLSNGNYKKVRLIDDSERNLKEFLKLRNKYPNIKFEAVQVTKDEKLKILDD